MTDRLFSFSTIRIPFWSHFVTSPPFKYGIIKIK
nr:MAG TPA: hypothetical protein [Caudoviricetes sp.]